MKKIFITIGCCFIILTSITAQDKKGTERKQHIQHQKHEIKKQLNLSEEQKSKMKSIQEKYREQMKELKDNDNITRGDFKKQMSTLHKKRKAEVEAIFTVEQKNKIKEMKENKEKKMKEKSAKHFEKMSNRLQLDEKQKATLLEQQRKNQEQIKSIRDDHSLSEVQKREKIKSIREKQKADTKSILTEEQKKKLEHAKKGQESKA